MEDHSFFADVLVFLVAAVVVVPIFQKLKSSLILGYLAAGLAIGPHVFGLVSNEAVTRALAELGVIFLLFTIGLELTIDRLRVIRRFIFGLGTAQFLVTSAIIGLLAVAAAYPQRMPLSSGARWLCRRQRLLYSCCPSGVKLALRLAVSPFQI